MNGRSLLKKATLIFNLVVAGAYVLSSVANLIDPNTLLFPAFFGLVFIPLLLINTFLLLSWLLFKPKFALINVLVIGLSWPTINDHFKWIPEQAENSKAAIDVMSFNVRLFDLYNWEGNRKTRDEILEFLQQHPMDVFCFQEFFNTNNPKYFNTLDTLLDLGVGREVHEDFTAVLHEGLSKFGIATLAEQTIIKRERIPLDTAINNIAIYSDLVLDQDTVRVFNIHLASVHLSGMEKEINKHLETNDQEGQLKDLRIISDRLSAGFKRRAKQAAVIRKYIDDSPYPVVVCGDLNDTPSSFAYATLSEGLQDAFLAHGFGMGNTYIGLFPLLRIDFIFVDPRLSIERFETYQVKLSDHRPIMARVNVRQQD